MDDELELDANTVELLTVLQAKDESTKALLNNTEGHYTCFY